MNFLRDDMTKGNSINISLDNTDYNVSENLITIINELTNAYPPYYGSQYAVTINFRDVNYSAEEGGISSS